MFNVSKYLKMARAIASLNIISNR